MRALKKRKIIDFKYPEKLKDQLGYQEFQKKD